MQLVLCQKKKQLVMVNLEISKNIIYQREPKKRGLGEKKTLPNTVFEARRLQGDQRVIER